MGKVIKIDTGDCTSEEFAGKVAEALKGVPPLDLSEADDLELIGINSLDGGKCAEQATAHIWEALHDLYARPEVDGARRVVVNIDAVCKKGIVFVLWQSHLKKPPMNAAGDAVFMQDGRFLVRKPQQMELGLSGRA